MVKQRLMKRGFTLIEIIIVIVIIGILATLALPKITGQLESSKAAEAMNMFGAIRRAANDCMNIAGGSGANCLTAAQLGVSTSNLAAGAKFTYSTAITNAGLATQYITVRARNSAGTAAICMDINYDGAANDALQVGYSAAPANSVYAGVVNRAIAGGAVAGAACATANLANVLNP